jgi:O-antigen/teichoic acid export membrane protein
MPPEVDRLVDGTRLAQNAVWNLVGLTAPMVVAVVSIPLLIAGLGEARFGILTLVWMVVGYFGLFDLGLGRALTMLVAERLGRGRGDEIAAIMWTVGLAILGLGLAGSALLVALAPWLAGDILKIPPELRNEARAGFGVLAVSIPFVLGTEGLRGFLEARQRFDLINAVRVPMGLFTFLGPLAVLPLTTSLVGVVGVLVAGRVVAWLVHLVLCLRVDPDLRRPARVSGAILRRLLGFGGWMTVSNIVGPLMVRMDRFLLGAMVSMVAVTYYVTPMEVVSRLSVVPVALMGVLFPAFATVLETDRNRAVGIFRQAVGMLLFILFPIALVLLVLAGPILQVWLGGEFVARSTLIMQILTLGVLLNGLAQVPFGLVQGAGRPEVTARLHLLELPLYLGGLWWLVRNWGIEGAAIAWTGRVVLDAVALFWMAGRYVPGSVGSLRRVALPLAGTQVAMVAGMLVRGVVWQVAYTAVVVPVFAVVMWRAVLGPSEKNVLAGLLRRPVRKLAAND